MKEDSDTSPSSAGTAELDSPLANNINFDLRAELDSIPEVEEEKGPDPSTSFIETHNLTIENENRYHYITHKGATLGRTPDNNIIAHSRSASSKHCKIEYIENSFYLSDRSSFNGTWIGIKENLQIAENMQIRIENVIVCIKELNFTKPEIVLLFPQLSTEVIVPKTTALIGKSEECDAIIRKSTAVKDIEVVIQCLENNQGLLSPSPGRIVAMRRLMPFQKHKLEVGDVFFCGEDKFIVHSSKIL